jgi:hypothetical protein
MFAKVGYSCGLTKEMEIKLRIFTKYVQKRSVGGRDAMHCVSTEESA